MFVFQEVDITLTLDDDSTESFSLEAPNDLDADLFTYGFRRLRLRGDYRDRNLIFRRGAEYYQFIAQLSYQWHYMDLRKLISAKKIALRFPPSFQFTDQYQEVDVRLTNDEVAKNFLRGLAMNSEIPNEPGLTPEDLNVVPSGSVQLEFEGLTAIESSAVVNYVPWHEFTAPAKVTGLALIEYGDGQATVSWDANGEANLAGYNLYVDGVLHNTGGLIAPGSETSYDITGLVNENQYTVRVSAVNDKDYEGAKSDALALDLPKLYLPNGIAFIADNDIIYTVDTSDGTALSSFDLNDNDTVRDLCIDPDNYFLYVSQFDGRLRKFSIDPVTFELTQIWHIRPDTIDSGEVVIDGKGNLWWVSYIGGWGIHKIDPADGSIIWSVLNADVNGRPDYGIAVGPDDKLYMCDARTFGSWEVAVMNSLTGDEIGRHQIVDTDGTNVSTDRASHPNIDQNGFLYLCTAGRGGGSGEKFVLKYDTSDFSQALAKIGATYECQGLRISTKLAAIGNDDSGDGRVFNYQTMSGNKLLNVTNTSSLVDQRQYPGFDDFVYYENFTTRDATKYDYDSNSDVWNNPSFGLDACAVWPSGRPWPFGSGQ